MNYARQTYRDNGHRKFDELEGVRARDIMTRDVATVHPQDTLEHAARLMADCDCGALPVTGENGRLLGVVTDRDIAVRGAAHGCDPHGTTVDQVMTHHFHAAHPEDALIDIIRHMSQHKIRRLPVVDRFDRVVGILSQGDIARHAGPLKEHREQRALGGMMYSISDPLHGPHRSAR